MYFIFIVFFIVGLVYLFAPEAMWELQERMRYKDSDREPSAGSLVLNRLKGLFIAGASLLILLGSCNGMIRW